MQGTGKPNSCSLLWSPSVHSQPRVCCSILPRIIPLGSSGGCQTIRTDVSLTSGNTSLTGGPGAAREHRDHGSKDYTAEGSQVFCSPCTELQPKTYLSNNGWQHLCVCIIHIHSEESAHGERPPTPSDTKHSTDQSTLQWFLTAPGALSSVGFFSLQHHRWCN